MGEAMSDVPVVEDPWRRARESHARLDALLDAAEAEIAMAWRITAATLRARSESER
jgi:hypothetical protein